jgi:hypothetical protein
MNRTYQNDDEEDILIEQQNKGLRILPFMFFLLIVTFTFKLYKILNRDLNLDNMIESDDIFGGRTMDIRIANKANAKKKIDTLNWLYNFNKSRQNN